MVALYKMAGALLPLVQSTYPKPDPLISLGVPLVHEHIPKASKDNVRASVACHTKRTRYRSSR